MATTRPAAVMLVGTSGAGKSTLGNFLLYGSAIYDGGFVSAVSREPVTTACTSRVAYSQNRPPFKVIDTPGLPDPNGNTKNFFDCIVREARSAGSLNAIVFVIDYSVNRNDVARSMSNASVLLEQFNKLGCTTIIACRVPPHVQGMNEDGIRSAELCWNRYVTDIANEAGLWVSTIYFLGADMVSQAREIRELVTRCPAVYVAGDSGMQTFDELKRCAENRRNEHTRDVQLKQDVERLKKETIALQGTGTKLLTHGTWSALTRRDAQMVADKIQSLEHLPVLAGAVRLVVGVAALASVGVVVAIADASSNALLHAVNQRNIALNKAAVARNERALGALTIKAGTSLVDGERLARDEDTLRKLNALDG